MWYSADKPWSGAGWSSGPIAATTGCGPSDAGGPDPADSERDGPDPTTAANNITMAAIAMTGRDRRGLVPSLNHTMIQF
ncbi:hypothetical protein L842_1311 [Mycobacterium intracellulare MIN_052511_1280]|nr:hypothetical protein L842_1311 [Mycobacterium intracellulare MIN_052511_1280]